MTEIPTKRNYPEAAIAEWLADFIRAMMEILRVGQDDRRPADYVRDEQQQRDAAEAAITAKHKGAWFRREQIRRRAAAHGVVFTWSATYEHQSTILDFLDNPRAAKPLTWGHLTWFHAVDADARQTSSLDHPVNRAKFIWNALDLSRRQPTGIASIDDLLARLAKLYPAECMNWRDPEWRAWDETRPKIELTASRPPSAMRPVGQYLRSPPGIH